MCKAKEKLIEHLKEHGTGNELQAGFKKEKNLKINILTLKYCIGNCTERKKEFFLTALDFSKAFNSVNRKKIIETDELQI